MIFRKIFGVWWSITLFLIFFQAWVMSELWWFIPFAFIVALAFGFGWFALLRWKYAGYVMLGIVILHFVPLVIGLFSLHVRLDVVFFALIGYLLYVEKTPPFTRW